MWFNWTLLTSPLCLLALARTRRIATAALVCGCNGSSEALREQRGMHQVMLFLAFAVVSLAPKLARQARCVLPYISKLH